MSFENPTLAEIIDKYVLDQNSLLFEIMILNEELYKTQNDILTNSQTVDGANDIIITNTQKAQDTIYFIQQKQEKFQLLNQKIGLLNSELQNFISLG